jgi:hypothetical protein
MTSDRSGTLEVLAAIGEHVQNRGRMDLKYHSTDCESMSENDNEDGVAETPTAEEAADRKDCAMCVHSTAPVMRQRFNALSQGTLTFARFSARPHRLLAISIFESVLLKSYRTR